MSGLRSVTSGSLAIALSALLFGGVLLAGVATKCFASVIPDGDATHVRTAGPGNVYRGTIALRNQGAAFATVKLYQTDYAFQADGKNSFGPPAGSSRSNAGWLRLEKQQVVIAPGDVEKVDYEVRVPDDERLEGTYWSVVMAQEIAGAEATGKAAADVSLRQTIRHAIQIVTEVGDAGQGEVAFQNATLIREADKRLLQVDIENTGARWLRTNIWVELHDEAGRKVGRFDGQKRRTFPGTSVRSQIDLTAAPPGRYFALLVADGGRNDLFGAQIDLELP